MDSILNIWVNITPFIISALFYFCYKYIISGKKIFYILLFVLNIIGFIPLVFILDGHGHIIISIIVIILFFLIYVFTLFFWGFRDKSLFWIILSCIMIFQNIYVIFKRLECEHLLNIRFINKINISGIFSKLIIIFENDWIKEIIIASISGIISGLVVNKISNKK